MGGKLLLLALLFIVSGLVLTIISDPLFRASFTGPSVPGFTGGNFTSFFRNGTTPASFANFSQFRNRSLGTDSAFGSVPRIEVFAGIGSIGLGSLFVVAQLFSKPAGGRRRRF